MAHSIQVGNISQMVNGFTLIQKTQFHRMKTGLFQLPSGSYYVDENAGMTASNWVSLPDGNFSWAQSDGSLVSGWFTTPGNKTWYFNPNSIDHAAYVGEHSIDGKNYYFDKSYGLAKNEWVTLSNGVNVGQVQTEY